MTLMNWDQLLCPERPRQSTSQVDHRIQFERDFDRAVFSTPVKRLQDKAQVFPLEPHDAVRTRLTHSLEVSCVARGLATSVAKWLLEEKHIKAGQDRQIEAIAATCGLIHDLGNPPFGHAGEEAIGSWFGKTFKGDSEGSLENKLHGDQQQVHDFKKFEGNAQSLRLVAKLQLLADYNGLNLTYGTLSALCKYIAKSNEIDKTDHAKSKPGYFASENDLVEEIRRRTGTGPARNPIAFLVEAADDIVYSVADIEDGIKKGVLRWKDLCEKLREDPKGDFNGVIDMTKHILSVGSSSERPDDVWASAFRTAAIGHLVGSVVAAFKQDYVRIMEGEHREELVTVCSSAPLVAALKKLGRERVYCTPSTLKLEIMGRKVIHDLMDLFWEGAQAVPPEGNPRTKDFQGKIATLISENYRKVFQHAVGQPDNPLPEDYHRLQLVTDQVCGMTDSFAKRMHGELTNGL